MSSRCYFMGVNGEKYKMIRQKEKSKKIIKILLPSNFTHKIHFIKANGIHNLYKMESGCRNFHWPQTCLRLNGEWMLSMLICDMTLFCFFLKICCVAMFSAFFITIKLVHRKKKYEISHCSNRKKYQLPLNNLCKCSFTWFFFSPAYLL